MVLWVEYPEDAHLPFGTYDYVNIFQFKKKKKTLNKTFVQYHNALMDQVNGTPDSNLSVYKAVWGTLSLHCGVKQAQMVPYPKKEQISKLY